jgi:addiction module HigA family antidote
MEDEENLAGKVHPGVFLNKIIRERNISQKALAEKLGVSKSLVNMIINGHRDLDVLLCYKLEQIFGDIEAESLIKLQYSFDLFKIRQNISGDNPDDKK